MILLVLYILLISGCGNKPMVDPQSGIMIRRHTPEATVITYFELLGWESFEAAHRLYTKESRDAVPVEMLERIITVNNLSSAQLKEMFPTRVEGKLAIVPHIQVNRFPGMPEASSMFGISTLKKEGKVWALTRDADELSDEEFMTVAKMMLTYTEELKDKLGELSGFTETQLSGLAGQLLAMQVQYEEVITILEDPEEYARIMEERMAQKLGEIDDDDPYTMPLDHYFDDERTEPGGSGGMH
jgi:hypothetical protein